MQIIFLKKGLVLIILLLFVGAGVIPSTVGTIEKKTGVADNTSRGYIQGMIDNASNGDTIYVPSGVYYEHIDINKSISLIGEDRNTTIIDGGGLRVISIYADEVYISGFRIQNCTEAWEPAPGAIEIFSDNNTITGNHFCNNYLYYWAVFGIHIYGSCNTISNNTFSDNDGGIFVDGYNLVSNNNTITDNIISDNGCGIELGFTTDNSIIGNTIRANGVGIGSSSHPGLCGDNNLISNNIIISNNEFGMGFWFFNNNNITGNIISSNNGTGIQLSESNGNIITGNNISNNTGQWGNHVGIDLNGVNNIIKDNIITNNAYGGIYLDGDNNFFVNNTISYNEGSGIRTLVSNNNTFQGNIIKSNDRDGINLMDSPDNIITGNTISNNRFGIAGDQSNTFISNTLSNNEYGIYLSGGNNNIQGNNFQNNTFNARFRYYVLFHLLVPPFITKSIKDTWEENYWGEARILPKIIPGDIKIGRYKIFSGSTNPHYFPIIIPCINIDWHPAQEPYDIG